MLQVNNAIPRNKLPNLSNTLPNSKISEFSHFVVEYNLTCYISHYTICPEVKFSSTIVKFEDIFVYCNVFSFMCWAFF